VFQYNSNVLIGVTSGRPSYPGLNGDAATMVRPYLPWTDTMATGAAARLCNPVWNLGPYSLCVAEDLLRLATRVVGEPGQLAYLLARTLLPGAARDRLHRDPSRPNLRLAAFIEPIDDFREDNGATRFVAASHRGNLRPEAAMEDPAARHPQEWIAVAPAGSCILYDGDVWHGYTANRSGAAREAALARSAPTRRLGT
jgi:ectoine hydroxylase-related dioxygenase (phytanoyl-CoA dioxygenase family)